MECKICEKRKFKTSSVTEFVRHFHLLHKVTYKSLLTCGYEDCFAKFKDCDRYQRHVEEFHKTCEMPSDTSFPAHEARLSACSSVNLDAPYLCRFPNCNYVASSQSSLRGHKFWKHKDESQFLNAADLCTNNELGDFHDSRVELNQISFDETHPARAEEYVVPNNDIEMLDEPDEIWDEVGEKDALFKKLVHLYLTLNSKFHVPETTLSFIAESYSILIEESLKLSRKTLLSKLKGCENVSHEAMEIILTEFSENCLKNFHRAGGPMRSSYMRKEEYMKNFRYVKPESINLGLNQNNALRRMSYVSIKKSLQNLFEDNSVYEQYLERKPKGVLCSNRWTDIHDGSVFQNHPLFASDRDAIQIIMHQDDVEMVNPLGSAKGTYKMTFYYFTIGNIHPWSRSRTDAKQLVIICPEVDVSYFGLQRILQPLIKELRELETEGIMIRGKNLKASILVLLGDNLGTHTVAGFMENFSRSHYFCRYCEEPRKEWKARWNLTEQSSLGGDEIAEESENESEESEYESDESDNSPGSAIDSSDDDSSSLRNDRSADNHRPSTSDEDDIPLAELFRRSVRKRKCPLRSKSSYEACVADLQRNPKGVKGVVADSQFNKLDNFHVILGTPPCVPHDVFEGFMPYDVMLALKKLSVKFDFSFEWLNRRITHFKFLGEDALDKPPAKLSVKKKKVSGHAIQNWVFLRFLPLLIADKITNKSDPLWKMILILIELMQLICSPVVAKSIIKDLKKRILEYLTQRVINLKEDLRPKHHFFEHYAFLVKVFGPLMRCSTLGFERKNKFFREAMRQKKNLKNATDLLATEHQRMQSALSVNDLYDKHPVLEDGNLLETMDTTVSILQCIMSRFGEETASSMMFAKRATFHNTIYEKGRVIVVSTAKYPELNVCKIELLCSQGDKLYAIGHQCSALLDPEMQVYYIHETGLFTLVSVDELYDYVPYPVYNYKNRSLIVLKHLYLEKHE